MPGIMRDVFIPAATSASSRIERSSADSEFPSIGFERGDDGRQDAADARALDHGFPEGYFSSDQIAHSFPLGSEK